jgi:hypothetical protein
VKIHILPHPKEFNVLWSCPRTEHLCRDGLSKIPEVQLVETVDEADFVFHIFVPQKDGIHKYDYTDINQLPKEKLVCIDNTDEFDRFYLKDPRDCFAYFKRSLCTIEERRKVYVNSHSLFPFNYCVLDGFLPENHLEYKDRSVKFGCYLRNSCPNRMRILQLARTIESGNSLVGEISGGSRSVGDNVYFSRDYFEILNMTQILLTAGPSYWAGDSRLWEALANGCLVFADNDCIPLPNPLIDGEHLVYYDINNLPELRKKINYYLENTEEAEKIANAGRHHALTYHSDKSRMQYVVDHLLFRQYFQTCNSLSRRK